MTHLWYVKSINPISYVNTDGAQFMELARIDVGSVGKLDAAISNLESIPEMIRFFVEHHPSDRKATETKLTSIIDKSQIKSRGKTKLFMVRNGDYKPGTVLTSLPPRPLCSCCVKPGDATPLY